MGVALGWMALALAAVAGAPDAGRGGVPIKYTVRFVEAEGVGWREAVFTRLTPVTRQGSATVWTAPHDVAKRLVEHAAKTPSAHTLRAPTVTAWSGAPVHITTRANRQLVTQVAWNGDDHSVEGKPETVRTGSAATMTGRKLDQGILVQMVLQDTQVIAVHRVPLAGCGEPKSSPEVRTAAYHADPCCVDTSKCCEAAENTKKTTTSKKLTFELKWTSNGVQLPSGRSMKEDVQFFQIGPDFLWARTQAATEPAKMHVERTEPAPAPKMTSGVVAASLPAPECGSPAVVCASCCKTEERAAVALEVPEIGGQEIAGEWLIPKDGILLVSFGPHTVADKDGKAVVRERLAIVEAEESAEPAVMLGPLPTMVPPGLVVPSLPGAVRVPPSLPAPSLYGAPTAIAPAFGPPPGPMVIPPAPMPPVPSRSIPQGYHSDGKAAELPPLPADEAKGDEDSSQSAEPRPTPQKKKSWHPEPAPENKPGPTSPTGDTATKKAQFTAPNLPVIPNVFQSAPSIGLQFLIPIKPVSLRLPFNRRLELEIFGRVVRNPEPARNSAELVTKPARDGATTK